jgi:NitT/TauT family transport system substrate-binding protein
MASRLTPLTKSIIGAVVFGGLALGYQHLKKNGTIPSTTETAATTQQTQVATSGSSTPEGGPLGSAGNPLKIGLNSFHGFGPGIYANGGSLKTQPGSIYDRKGLHVEFVLQDDLPTLQTIFTAHTANCSWRTSDWWAQEHPNLRNGGLDGRAIFIVDNTQGADAIIARDPNIRSIEDLADHSVALLQFTPSHGLLTYALNNSSLSGRKKSSVKQVFINADEGTTGVLAALTSGNVQAAALWDPDLSTALTNGAHVIYSTKIASNLIFDTIICDTKYLTPANDATFSAFVGGWMEGVEQVNRDKSLAVTALINNMDFYKQLADKQGKQFVQNLYNNLVLTGLADNIRILGLADGTNHFERVYHEFDGIYRQLGALANPNSPVINPSESFEYKYIRSLMAAQPMAAAESKKPVFTFSVAEGKHAEAAPAAVTKPVVVNFGTNEALLNARAKDILDKEVAPLIDTYGSAYFEISGNTDSTGTAFVNKRISLARAQSVVDYLVTEWQFPRERFTVIGNGPDKPLCNESNPDGTLEDCRAMNRTTRIAVHAR